MRTLAAIGVAVGMSAALLLVTLLLWRDPLPQCAMYEGGHSCNPPMP